MKKMLGLLIILFFIYFLIGYIFSFFGYGHNIKYKIIDGDKIYEINELLSGNIKNEEDNYYYEIKYNDIVFSFQTFNIMKKKEKTITDIKVIDSNNYVCIFPIFEGNKILTDALCQNNKITYNYQSIKGNIVTIDNFFANLKEYNQDLFNDNLEEKVTSEQLTVYPNNLLKNHYLTIDHYKGVSIIKKENDNVIKSLSFFNKDIYTRKLSFLVNNIYITADYNKEFEFDTFNVVDIKNDNVKMIKSSDKLSFDAFFQGVYNNSLYIIDVDAKKQYEIDIKKQIINQIGNGKAYDYKDNQLVEVNIADIIKNKKMFDMYKDNKNIDGYEKVLKVGGNKSGYYYLYRKNNDRYDVYRTSVQNINNIQYLFSINDIEEIKYVYDTVYFLEKDQLKLYNDKTSIRTVLKSPELEFNNSIFYGVYYKK